VNRAVAAGQRGRDEGNRTPHPRLANVRATPGPPDGLTTQLGTHHFPAGEKRRREHRTPRGSAPHPGLLSSGGNNGGSAPVMVEGSRFRCRPAATRETTPTPGPQGERRALHPQRRRGVASHARPTAEPPSPSPAGKGERQGLGAQKTRPSPRGKSKANSPARLPPKGTRRRGHPRGRRAVRRAAGLNPPGRSRCAP